jgi:hypothetical protein
MMTEMQRMNAGVKLQRLNIRENGVEKVVSQSSGLHLVKISAMYQIILGLVQYPDSKTHRIL